MQSEPMFESITISQHCSLNLAMLKSTFWNINISPGVYLFVAKKRAEEEVTLLKCDAFWLQHCAVKERYFFLLESSSSPSSVPSASSSSIPFASSSCIPYVLSFISSSSLIVEDINFPNDGEVSITFVVEGDDDDDNDNDDNDDNNDDANENE
ncbi:hypothetical protein PHYBLDRAFT_140915 [Phycomyces blakesleeanus NRRL 1555(-)]|uniref:Uncharacterized protein n=1 Tax=Phycomyces blakesleeanus (strain ATCC 8743b / DSM 1359 / FGSC 10004 / NBRC 33097 / NRRL 1555) TaxID=763407 RepID=A0A167Q0F8_PHYB8|nr:hypothetical protein PHYBLDRAFT_140915 [Phycomyces blakesleeanus NRRL 1555(-)]OAD78864.1 hypothetical protein PHYBLDRAFT_140915 [Phycomyces blakesleeanus NRRL 1555(-)]|eukprot:XP_018296904.1 hypothetical protein PHYBLDRAFT_140915 [Phycomyces blakesleeanus NRRL 1555(-)]